MIASVIVVAILAFSFVSGALDSPECALQCYDVKGVCEESDSACPCRDVDLQRSAALCILAACPAKQFEPAIQAAQAFCTAAGAPLRNPIECAMKCYSLDSRDCDRSDVPCRCRDSELMKSVTECAVAACPTEQSNLALEVARHFCSDVGAPIASSSNPPNASTTTVPASGTPSTASATSSAQVTEDVVSQNANSATSRNINVVAGVVAFGLVALAI